MDIFAFIYGLIEDKYEAIIPDCVLYASSKPAEQKSDSEATLPAQITEKTNPTDLTFTILENSQTAPLKVQFT